MSYSRIGLAAAEATTSPVAGAAQAAAGARRARLEALAGSAGSDGHGYRTARLPVLATRRLRLLPAGAGDLDALWVLWRDPQVSRFMFDERLITRIEAAQLLFDRLGGAAEGLGMWLVHAQGFTRPVGLAGLGHRVGQPRRQPAVLEPVVALHPGFRGRGYAQEALRALVAHADALRPAALEAVSELANTSAQRLLQSLCFEPVYEADGHRGRLRLHRRCARRCAAV